MDNPKFNIINVKELARFRQLFVLILIVSAIALAGYVSDFRLGNETGEVLGATSPWTQTDWSGGDGQTNWIDPTMFSSASNIGYDTNSEIKLGLSEVLTNNGFEDGLTGWSDKQDYILDDEFTTDRAAGSVNGSQAEPTGGARVVTDTDSKASIQGGKLIVNNATATGNPGLWYGLQSRTKGMLILSKLSGSVERLYFGWDIDQSSHAVTTNSTTLLANNQLLIYPGPLNLLGQTSANTTYNLAVILKDSGAYHFIKGGIYTDWTLFGINNSSNQNSLYPVVSSGNSTSSFEVDNVRIPVVSWLPTPLAYDTFTRSDGNANQTESLGPDAQTTPTLQWEGSGVISNNTLTITPTKGSELLNNRGLEAPYASGIANGWVSSEGGILTEENSIVHSGSSSQKNTGPNSSGVMQYIAGKLQTGSWFQGEAYFRSVENTVAYILIWDGAAMGPGQNLGVNSSWSKIVSSFRSTTNGIGSAYFRLGRYYAGNTSYFDSTSLKQLSLPSLFSTTETGKADVLVSTDITEVPNTQYGIVLNMDSASNPQNFVLVYRDAGNIKVDKVVGGVYTNAQTSTSTYTAGGKLQVVKSGNTYAIYYNNVRIGSEVTISEPTIVNNTRHGLFSTYEGNKFDNFAIWPRTGYTDAPFEDLTATTNNETTYNNSTTSIQLTAQATDGVFLQKTNTNDTETYTLETYAYKNGSAITSNDIELYINNNTVETTYTDAGNGWYKLQSTYTATNTEINYGVKVKAGKTIYIDDISLNRYADSGTLTSSIFDSDYNVGADWKQITYTSNKPGATDVTVKVRSGQQSNLSDAADWELCNHIDSGTELLTTDCVEYADRYIQYQVTLARDGTNTPSIQDISINFTAADNVPPIANATSVELTAGVSGQWNRFEDEITWVEGEDDSVGQGILGYCISLDEAEIGLSNLLDPVSSAGLLTGLDDGVTESYCPFIATGDHIDLSQIAGLTLTSGKHYFFSIKAVDLLGNVWTGDTEDYQDLVSFKYDNTPPTNIGFISLPGSFIATKDVTITWPTTGNDSANDLHSGLAGLQYRIGSDGVWYGQVHDGSESLTDLLDADGGSYITDPTYDYPNLTDGNNYIYFRAIDNAGNISAGYVTGVLKLNTSAPSSVLNLEVSPESNNSNLYAFSWDPPTTYIGQLSNITYCYTINTVPTINTCNFTGPGVTTLSQDAYATQPGENTLYVVARDEALNINFDTNESVSFTYSGSAPGIPLGISVSDISIKSTANWKLAISWDAPEDIGAGVEEYKVYSSTSDSTCSSSPDDFELIGTTRGTSYVHAELLQQNYYYCVKACDSANNCSAYSTTASEYPSGKYTAPAVLISKPKVTSISTRKATIDWVTDRTSNSRIQYGLESDKYYEEDIGSGDQVTNHSLTLNNLEPGTLYYFKANWTDEDGNTGYSSEFSFETAPPPTISKVNVSRIGLDNAIVSFTISDAIKAQVNYGETSAYGASIETNTSTAETSYSIPLQALKDGTKYHYQLKLEDLEGSTYTFEDHEFSTLPRPHISNVRLQEVQGAAQPTIEVSWTSNTSISSIIEYYKTGEAETSQEDIDLELINGEHLMRVDNLLPNTKYSMFVKGFDAYGNKAISEELLFTTALDSRPPKVLNVKVEGAVTMAEVGGNPEAQLIISWDTDELTTGFVEFGEGTSNAYTSKTSEEKIFVNNHVIVIPDLDPSKVYHVRVTSVDLAGNIGKSKDVVVITPKGSSNVLELVLGNLADIFSFLK